MHSRIGRIGRWLNKGRGLDRSVVDASGEEVIGRIKGEGCPWHGSSGRESR